MLEQTTYSWLKDNSIVQVKDNRLEVTLSINAPFQDKKLSVKDLKKLLNESGVLYGIDENVLSDIIYKHRLYENIIVARGTSAKKGRDGFYEFLFNTELEKDKGPFMLEDGSVDYSVMERIEMVKKGQVLARYTKRYYGEEGMDVFGNTIKVQSGKDLLPLRGKGFEYLEDIGVYVASVDGKVELLNNQLIVSDLLEIKEDVNYVSNKITFIGDILVHGDVMAGTTIETKGSIHVRGHVESAILIAGKDVILDKGMQGGIRGRIICEGNVSGKFFEQVRIQTKGTVSANAILNCFIETEGEVIVSGKKGIIVGGVVSAISGVKAAIIGNSSEIKTSIRVGLSEDKFSEVNELEDKIRILQERISQIDDALAIIASRDTANPKNPFQKQRIKLLSTKVAINDEINAKLVEKGKLLSIIERALFAKIRVEQFVEPGVSISVNGLSANINLRTRSIIFMREEGQLIQQDIAP